MANDIVLSTQNALDLMPVMDIDTALARRGAMVKFVEKILVKDTDFGVIPGTGNKATLLKPGAEKLTTFFGLSKMFEIVERVEDWLGKDHDGEPFFYYLYRCRLYRGDLLVAESDGSCNSFESKYRWRKSERVCPNCGQPTIIKGKDEYGGGWLCYKNKGGCGAKFRDGSTEIESQSVGMVPNPDIASQVNTIQKMAQKRALIAATLLAVNASEFFTQDLEDMTDDVPSFRMSPTAQPHTDAVDAEYRTVQKPTTNGNGNGHKPPTAEAPKFPFERIDGQGVHINAIEWAMTQNVFNARQHAENSYKKLSGEMKYHGPSATREQTDALLWAWVEKVNAKAAEMQTAPVDNPFETPEPVAA